MPYLKFLLGAPEVSIHIVPFLLKALLSLLRADDSVLDTLELAVALEASRLDLHGSLGTCTLEEFHKIRRGLRAREFFHLRFQPLVHDVLGRPQLVKLRPNFIQLSFVLFFGLQQAN